MPLTILRLPLSALASDPRNARVHDERNIEAIRASLLTFGQAEPLVVQAGTRRLIAGHGRLEAMRRLAWTEADVVELAVDDRQATALGIALNRTAELAGWDDGALAALLKELGEEGALEGVGFDEAEIAALLGAAASPDAAAPGLADRFGVPPFSILDARQGYWQDRKDEWLRLGIQSEIGRGNDGDPSKRGLVFGASAQPPAAYKAKEEFDAALGAKSSWAEFAAARPEAVTLAGTSVFDPVLCELAYRWFCPRGGAVLDPFAGGSVRGIVAGVLGRRYVGVELRAEQVAANRAQERLAPEASRPKWIEGDSAAVVPELGEDFDFLFSCPPYHDLEVYSDDPRDLSAMEWDGFVEAHRRIVAAAAERLRPERFAVWVVGEVRGPDGAVRGIVPETIDAFARAGLRLYNDAVLVTATSSLPIRVGRSFVKSRKLGRTHQYVLAFWKGDPRRVHDALGPLDDAAFGSLGE